jgi:protoheme IX farnesyltransferase
LSRRPRDGGTRPALRPTGYGHDRRNHQQHDGTPEAQFGDYVQLLKPRVMSLVVFTALVGLLVAPGGVSPMVGFSAILFIALGAGASGALNMWYDADIDAS